MHRSMAGASTAQGVDALGALFWNPAAISGLPGSEVVIGSEMIIPNTHLGSTVPAGAFGPLGPATTLSGLTRSDSGLVPTTGLGLVYQSEDMPLSYGLGVVTLAAGGVNFPGDAGNPILAPTGPLNQFILGPQVASAAILAIEPTVSYRLGDRLAVGFGPMIDVSVVSFDPAFFGPTSQARVTDPRVFPTGAHTRPFWGGGFRGGVTYRVADHLTAGFSYTSPQWFETWRFYARDASGNPFTFKTQFTLPQVFSLGAAYDGIENLLLTADLRWFDYRTTKLLGQPVREGGAGWDSVWAVALGARYQLSERLSAQVGYLYNENPVPSDLALFNTQLPALIKHTFSVGSYFQVNDSIGLSLAYVHGFKNSISGSVFPLRGTSTTIDSEYDSLALSIHIKFGGPRCKSTSPAEVAAATPAPVEAMSASPRPVGVP
jgi:long-chain fatty acid transport protein